MKSKSGFRQITLAIGSLVLIPALRAETATWIGNGNNANWGQVGNSELNWVGGVIPNFGDTLDVVFHAEDAARLENFLAGGSTTGPAGNWDPTYGRRVRTLNFNSNADNDIIIHTSQTTAASGSHRPLQFDTDANGYSGDTTVTAGTLRLTTAALADAAAVRLGGDAVLDLAHGLSDTVAAIHFDGIPQASGTWGSSDSSAKHIDDDRFLGTGMLYVPSLFETWAASRITVIDPAAAAGFDDDPDNDGIPNGLEWILGGNPLAQDAAGLVTPQGDAATGLTLAFTRAKDSLAETTLTVQWDTGLDGTWPGQVEIRATSSPPDINGVTVTIDNSGDPDLVTVLIPATNAPTGRIFARLAATLNP